MSFSRDDKADVFEELLSRFQGTIRAYCHLHSDSIAEAQDMMQEVLATVWQQMDTLRARTSWQQRLWLWRVMRSVAANVHRRPHIETLPLEAAAGVADSTADDERLLEELLNTLPPIEADLMRRHLDGYSYSEIGHALGLTRDVVAKHLRRAKEHLQQNYDEQYGNNN